MLRNYIGLLMLLMVVSGSVASQTHADWQSLYYRDHPFVGKVFSTQNEAWITVQQLDVNLQYEQFILLGEVHTNPDHHIGQANIIKKWLSKEQPTALVLEMLAYEDWKQFVNSEHSLNDLSKQLEKVSSQWDWELYSPILQMKINHQLPMVGANLTRKQLDGYSSSEKCQMTRGEIALEFCDLLTKEKQASIKQLIFDAHCGYLPLEHTGSLMRAQMAKDASFALSVANMGETHKVALIAGSVHIRKDIGVPVHLQRLGKQSVSIAFVNVDPDKLSVEDYVDYSDLKQQFDYLYFTPSERNQDPCVEFAEQLKTMKKPTK